MMSVGLIVSVRACVCGRSVMDGGFKTNLLLSDKELDTLARWKYKVLSSPSDPRLTPI